MFYLLQTLNIFIVFYVFLDKYMFVIYHNWYISKFGKHWNVIFMFEIHS